METASGKSNAAGTHAKRNHMLSQRTDTGTLPQVQSTSMLDPSASSARQKSPSQRAVHAPRVVAALTGSSQVLAQESQPSMTLSSLINASLTRNAATSAYHAPSQPSDFSLRREMDTIQMAVSESGRSRSRDHRDSALSPTASKFVVPQRPPQRVVAPLPGSSQVLAQDDLPSLSSSINETLTRNAATSAYHAPSQPSDFSPRREMDTIQMAVSESGRSRSRDHRDSALSPTASKFVVPQRDQLSRVDSRLSLQQQEHQSATRAPPRVAAPLVGKGQVMAQDDLPSLSSSIDVSLNGNDSTAAHRARLQLPTLAQQTIDIELETDPHQPTGTVQKFFEKGGKSVDSAPKQAKPSKATEKAEKLAAVNSEIISDLRKILLQRFQDEAKTRPALEASANIEKVLSVTKEDTKEFAFHDRCLDIMFEHQILEPDSYEVSGKAQKEVLHKYKGPEAKEKPQLFHEKGIYFCEPSEQPSGIFSGYAIWVSVRSVEIQASVLDVFKHEGSNYVTGALTLTIICGLWKDKDDDKTDTQLLEGSMLHVHLPAKNEGTTYQRCVGFSYKGTLLLEKKAKGEEKKAQDVPEYIDVFKFHNPDQNSVFREFEFTIPSTGKDFSKDIKEMKNCEETKIPYRRRVPLKLMAELFIDCLWDDGKERKNFREFESHRKFLIDRSPNRNQVPIDASPHRNQDFVDFLAKNYISAGLQYFVPSIAKSTISFVKHINRHCNVCLEPRACLFSNALAVMK
jgi:hypothetical protein